MASDGSRKRKQSKENYPSHKKTRKVCVIHFEGSDCKQFTYLSKCKKPDNTLNKLVDIANIRMDMPNDSASRMENTCTNLFGKVTEESGYHRDCYQRFTMNLPRLQMSEGTAPPLPTASAALSSSVAEPMSFEASCIFCNNERRKKNQAKEKLDFRKHHNLSI